METTKLSSKGQIVLPKSVRDALAWPVGAELTIERGADSVTIRRRAPHPPKTVDDVAGMFKTDRRISLEDMEDAIEEALRERASRNR